MIFAPVESDDCKIFSCCFRFMMRDAMSASSVYEIDSFNAVCEVSSLLFVISNLFVLAPNFVISLDNASVAVSKFVLSVKNAEESKVDASSLSLNDTSVEKILLS